MNESAITRLPLSWRSYLRAGSFTVIMLVFGIGALAGAEIGLRLIGVALTIIGLVVGGDFAWGSRRWCFTDERLWVPRAWSPRRSIGVSGHWRPSIESVGRRDSIFEVQTAEGLQNVTPNLLVARSDVQQWLHLIGEARTGTSW